MSSLDYSASIEITFDKDITNDPEIITGLESYSIFKLNPFVAIANLSSGDNASYPKDRAFDGSTSTYWRSSSTTAGQWIGRDFGGPVTLSTITARFDYASGRPNAYALQGCDDGSSWADITTGNFANASGDQVVNFAATTYRYWRLYFSSRYSSYYTCTEFTFPNPTRNTYDVTGWTVSATQYDKSPEGNEYTETYTVYKVTKPASNVIKLWLDMADRIGYPAGDLTVTYDGLAGNLRGAGDVAVESFSIPCSLNAGLAVKFNPHDVENVEIANLTAVVTLTQIYYSSYQNGSENIEVSSLATSAILTHIDYL